MDQRAVTKAVTKVIRTSGSDTLESGKSGWAAARLTSFDLGADSSLYESLALRTWRRHPEVLP
ncbi:hypothetical protein AB5J72_48975 [Streptomyces sp. CG1]|uniref:hypothetical protein n=1 Tax=Streptomyces sp. CG1 TaxID=1287523 RepID=UPI0034E2207C